MDTIILIEEYNDESRLNKRIKEAESKGYVVKDTKITSGTGFSEYSKDPTIIVVMSK